jgi:hypothetical protein
MSSNQIKGKVNNIPEVNNTTNNGADGEELSPPAKMLIANLEFICRIIDKAGVAGVNMLGSFLNLNVDGKNITEQSTEELFRGLESLSEKLNDPKVKEALDIAIEELSPVVQKSAIKFVNLYIEVFKTGVISSVAVACEVPPLSVLCGMSKSASAFLDLAAKAMGIASSSIDDMKEAKETSKKITNVLSENTMPGIELQPINRQTVPIKGGGYIQIGGNTLKNLTSIQSAGSQIEKRIDHSIEQFNNPLKYYKNITGKNKNKNKSKIKKNRNYGTKKYKIGKRG